MKKIINAKITAVAVMGILILLIFATAYDKVNENSRVETESTTPSESIILKDIFILSDNLEEPNTQPESILLKDIFILSDA